MKVSVRLCFHRIRKNRKQGRKRAKGQKRQLQALISMPETKHIHTVRQLRTAVTGQTTSQHAKPYKSIHRTQGSSCKRVTHTKHPARTNCRPNPQRLVFSPNLVIRSTSTLENNVYVGRLDVCEFKQTNAQLSNIPTCSCIRGNPLLFLLYFKDQYLANGHEFEHSKTNESTCYIPGL